MLKSEGHAEPALPLNGPGIAILSPHCTGELYPHHGKAGPSTQEDDTTPPHGLGKTDPDGMGLERAGSVPHLRGYSS